jgi:(p)ppGpp synthase/HD superfamily hydrolase
VYNQLRMAIDVAFIWHEGQKRLDGSAYIYHPLSVMMNLQDEPYIVQVVAVLHDIVEDTKFTLKDIELNFGPEVATAIEVLTKTEAETYDQYINRIKTSGNDIAIKVKRADLVHNLSTISNVKDPFKRQVLKDRYYAALRELS